MEAHGDAVAGGTDAAKHRWPWFIHGLLPASMSLFSEASGGVCRSGPATRIARIRDPGINTASPASPAARPVPGMGNHEQERGPATRTARMQLVCLLEPSRAGSSSPGPAGLPEIRDRQDTADPFLLTRIRPLPLHPRRGAGAAASSSTGPAEPLCCDLDGIDSEIRRHRLEQESTRMAAGVSK